MINLTHIRHWEVGKAFSFSFIVKCMRKWLAKYRIIAVKACTLLNCRYSKAGKIITLPYLTKLEKHDFDLESDVVRHFAWQATGRCWTNKTV